MKFYASTQRPPVGAELIGRQSILTALLPLIGVLLFLGAIAAAFLYHDQCSFFLRALIVIAGGLAIPSLIRSMAASFKSSNWSVAIEPRGLWLNLRSFRNYRLEVATTVVFIPFDELDGASAHARRHEQRSSDGTATWTERALDLSVSSQNWDLLREHLAEERRRHVTTRWFGCTVQGRSNHVPISTPVEGTLRIAWRTPYDLVRPKLDKVLTVLSRYVTVSTSEANLPPLDYDKLLDDQVDEQVLALVEQGRKLDAIRVLRTHKGMRLTEAKQFVDELETPAVPERT